jgi:DNA-binding SARP family transcriptional activator/tetratricopeptide (TPR) repeat protein
LRVRVLGQFDVEGVEERAFGSRKARMLAARLALAAGMAVSADELVDVLWGAHLPAHPRDQLGVLVARCRRAVGAHQLVRVGGGYALRVDWLDLRAFEQLASEATEAWSQGRAGVAGAAAAAAMELAGGRVLPDEDGDWLLAARVSAESSEREVLRIAAQAALASGDDGAAITLAERCLTADPYDEVALRLEMTALAATGRVGSALAAYARVRARLVEDLGVSPGEETERLHRRLLGVEPAPVAAAPPRREWGIFGRSQELAVLDEALAAAEAGPAVLVTVGGVGGIGKSALVRSWTGSLDPSRFFVCVGRCDPLGRDLPLQPIGDALADTIRGSEAGGLAALAGDELAVVRFLAGPGDGERHRDPAVPIDHTAEQHRLFVAVLEALRGLAGGRTVVLVVEDLHWAGSSTLAWLALSHRRGERLLLVATLRPDGPVLAGEHRIELGPLDVVATTDWFGAELGPSLHARTDGVPLLLSAAAAIDGEASEAVELRTVIERELARLAPAAETVGAAAVLGPDVDLELLADVLGTDAVTVLRHLEAAVSAGLLVDGPGGLGFTHEMVREEVERRVPSSRRALLNRRAAREVADRPGSSPLVVALYARRGGDEELAALAWTGAAEQAARLLDLDWAEALLAEALALGERPDPLIVRARVRMARLDLAAAAVDAERAIALGGGSEALEVAGWVAYYQRRYEAAAAYADGGRAMAPTPEAATGCLALSGRVAHSQGDLRSAIDRLEAADSDPHESRRVAAVWRAMALLHGGRPAEALAVTNLALSAGGVMAHPFAGLHGHFAKAMALGHLGRIGEALAACDLAELQVEEAGVVGDRFRDRMANVRGWLLRSTGQIATAADIHSSVIDRAGGAGGGPANDAVAEAFWVAHLDLADGWLLAGDLERAGAAVAHLSPVRTWDGTMAWHQRHRADLLAARLALAQGDCDLAQQLAGAVHLDAQARSARRYELLASAVREAARPERPLDEVSVIVDGLASCAGLEAWWLTAAIARQHQVEEWRALAERRAADLIQAAGEEAAPLERWARRVLDGSDRLW